MPSLILGSDVYYTAVNRATNTEILGGLGAVNNRTLVPKLLENPRVNETRIPCLAFCFISWYLGATIAALDHAGSPFPSFTASSAASFLGHFPSLTTDILRFVINATRISLH